MIIFTNCKLLRNIYKNEITFNVLNTEKKSKTFTFKTTFSTEKSIITITSKTHIIITFAKFTISIIVIKVKVDVDAKKFMCYNYNQIKYIK